MFMMVPARVEQYNNEIWMKMLLVAMKRVGAPTTPVVELKGEERDVGKSLSIEWQRENGSKENN